MDSDEQILRDALDILRDGGMCKIFFAQGESHCARGAVLKALEPNWNGDISSLRDRSIWKEEQRISATYLTPIALDLFHDRLDDNGWDDIATVNNHPDTVLSDMEVVFEKAAIRAAERI
jgi:hypothetical protein